MESAESTLIDALGLRGWCPPEPLTYTRSAAVVADCSRLDAQYHAPAVDALRVKLASRFELAALADLGEVTNGRTVQYAEEGSVPIIRSGDVGKARSPAELLRAPSAEPIFYLCMGDVLISSIGFGSIGRVETVTSDDAMGTVSEVTVVRQSRLDSQYISAFLRCSAGQLQLNRLITGATGQLHLYPRDVRGIFIPLAPEELQTHLRIGVRKADTKRQRSQSLLAVAKRAVEIAIAGGEVAALRFVSERLEAPYEENE